MAPPIGRLPAPSLGPLALGCIFLVLGIILLLTGQCDGYWAVGFGLLVLGVGMKLYSLADSGAMTVHSDVRGWALLAVFAIPGVALVIVGLSGAC